MKQNTAELLNNYGGEIYEAYSGRGMYGKETTGITFDSDTDFYSALADCIHDAVEDGSMEDGDLLTDMLRKLKTDNMGTGIIYY